MTELENMLVGLPPERQEAILKRADELEVYFSGDIVMMKEKGEEWVDGMLDGIGEGGEIIQVR